MQVCICSNCKNLKSVVDEQDIEKNGITEVCEFGFPSDLCLTCEADECELTCENYIEDQEDEINQFVMVKCTKCGQEVKHMTNNNDNSEVYCVTCYLNK